MKVGIVLEGGAMRGMYTAGVLDVLMENILLVGKTFMMHIHLEMSKTH